MSLDPFLCDSHEEKSNLFRASSMMVASDNFDEGDVIAETPQKVKKKKSLKKCRKVNKINTLTALEIQNCTEENIQHYLSNKFCVTRNDSEFMNTNKYCVENVNVRYKRPYVFFEIKDVLNFTELYQPLNENIKMIGVYKQKHLNVHYLMEFKKNCAKIVPMRILIDLKLSTSFPVEDRAIEVYGFIKYCRDQTKCIPVFVVKFWTSIGVDFDRYLKCLRQQKPHIPCCYKNIKLYDNEFKDLDVNRSIDYSFDEIDESILNKNVEHLEQIYHEINQIMSISEDVFV